MDIEPKIQYQALTEAAIFDALADSNPENPVAQEVSRLIGAYTQVPDSHAENPERLRLSVPRFPIQTVALRLVREAATRARNPRADTKP